MSEFSTIELSTSDRPTRFQVDPVEYRHKQPESDAEIDEDDTFPENEDITSKRRSSRWMSDVNIINALQKKKKKTTKFYYPQNFPNHKIIISNACPILLFINFILFAYTEHILSVMGWWLKLKI